MKHRITIILLFIATNSYAFGGIDSLSNSIPILNSYLSEANTIIKVMLWSGIAYGGLGLGFSLIFNPSESILKHSLKFLASSSLATIAYYDFPTWFGLNCF